MSITRESVERMNRWSDNHYKSTMKNLQEYENDSSKEDRLRQLECKTCFYLRGDFACFQAFTTYFCGHCGESKMHHNGNTPRYCESCCDEHSVCCRCGANV